ncbi:hypothetical protein [Vibrio parahaemolyticus]|uniref:hypothetical protein n=1 Tax=Vibrio parahaemolyticus TaxID=670 RepID=UPI000A380317|nr:hypothetical protein [Vibrio parahaemolyticus]EGR1143837.1 hypothetical protein [Vibrio parahaemolyticus]OUD22786.1 hypothetical protein BUN10_18575 [Vibrio parahaemolyticus]
MFILTAFKNEHVEQEDFEMALNCSAGVLASLLDDENLEVIVDEENAQVHIKLNNGSSPKKKYTLEQFQQLSKKAFMENGLLYEEFHHLEVVEK